MSSLPDAPSTAASALDQYDQHAQLPDPDKSTTGPNVDLSLALPSGTPSSATHSPTVFDREGAQARGLSAVTGEIQAFAAAITKSITAGVKAAEPLGLQSHQTALKSELTSASWALSTAVKSEPVAASVLSTSTREKTRVCVEFAE